MGATITAQMLYGICATTPNEICIGIFNGWWSVLWVAKYAYSDVRVPICLPAGTTPLHLMVVFMKFLQTYPNEASLPYPPVIMVALQKAFPCR
jgi:hypothetical protein